MQFSYKESKLEILKQLCILSFDLKVIKLKYEIKFFKLQRLAFF